ncbi:SMC6 (YLR383W) [Zygosaccharomyces parabailii]|nr:SMC6 (YLR383W) [Zygosaccharomyces parabailii]
MIPTLSSNKRNFETFDNDLISFANSSESHSNGTRRSQLKRRHFNVSPMTQFPDTADAFTQETQSSLMESPPSGYIKKITLWNFMCHEHFELELGPRLNFIVGNNGSGKSAILTAITVGLGAKASDTNRGTSLKDLIREGCHSTKIILRLDNSSYGAYNQGKFGKEIIIERTIRKDGTSSFSLKSENGKEVSCKKRDIQAAVDFFSVPISNPMCFLSQDAARSFLTASTSAEKYTFFMKGTLLQDVTDHLEQAKSISSSAQESMSLHQDNLNNLKEEYEDAKKLLRELNQTTDLNQRKRLLQGKALWLDVAQNKEACQLLREEIAAYEGQIELKLAKMRSKQERIDRICVDRSALEKEVENKVLSVAEKDSEHQEARDLLRNIKANFEKERQNRAEAQTSIDQCEQKINTLNSYITRLEDEIRSEMGGDKSQMRRHIEQLENENEKLGKYISSLSLELQDLQNDEKRITQERNSEIQKMNHELQRKKNELRQVAQGNSNFLNNFDERMILLKQTIEKRAGEFESPPIGPIGSLITIKGDFGKWTRSIQRAISSTLSSFVVSNHKDNRLFRELLKSSKIKANIPVITYKPSYFDYSNGKSCCGYPTVADALEFSSPEIECLLVDQNKIEKIVLVEDKEDARKLLKQQPRNVSMTLSLRDHRSGYQITGGYRLDTVNYQDVIRIKVGSSSDEGIEYVKDLINNEIREIDMVNHRYGQKLEQVHGKILTMDKELRQSRRNLKDNNIKITNLKINVGKEVDTGILGSKLEEKKIQEQAINGYKAALEELDLNIEQIAQRVQPLKEQYNNTRSDLLKNQEELQQLKEDINNRASKVAKFNDDIKHYELKIDSYNEKIEEKKNNIRVLERGIEDQINNAQLFCSEEQIECVDIPSNPEEIKRELENISKLMRKAEKQLGLPQQKVLEIFEKSRDKYQEGQEKFLQMSSALETLYNSIQVRLQNLQSAQRTTCLDADLDFRASLRVRNFSGNLSFITSSKRLEIYILTPNDEKARNVDTLSGGEKSFSQMALLLATWKPMRSRIIALDEFDVFMDQVNRKIGTALILKKLKDIARTQTIIITPQDIGKIADINSQGVNVHRMKDPERQNNSNFYEHTS